MELIYLWADKYRNLNGGYCLTGNLCVTKSNNTLEIKTNTNHLNNLFSEHGIINISALIGENGSGKSNILNLIIKLIYKTHKENKSYSNNYLIYRIEGEYFSIGNSDIEFIFVDGNAIKINKNEVKFYSLYMNNMIDSLMQSEDDHWINNIYHRSDNYKMPLLLEPYKNKNIIDINNIDYLTEQRIYSNLNNRKINNTNKIFNPEAVEISINDKKIIPILKRYITENEHKEQHLLSNHKGLLISLQNTTDIEESEKHIFKRHDKYTSNLDSDSAGKLIDSHNELIKQARDVLIKQIYKTPISIINYIYIQNKASKFNLKNDKNKRIWIDFKDKETLTIKHNIKNKSHETRKIINAIDFQNNTDKNNNLYNTRFLIKDKNIPVIPSWMDVNLFDCNNLSFKNLSSGEKTTYRFFSTINYLLDNLLSRIENNLISYENITLLLDEVDLGLHPKWQRDFIYNLISFLNNYSKYFSFHIICTSHSPFIASDLPKSNILFLDHGYITNLCTKNNTFAENIHSLLSDSFFMNDHLLTGKFAAKKIQSTFDFLHSITDKNDDEITSDIIDKYKSNRDNIIKLSSIIGDDYIKVSMMNSIELADNITNKNNTKNDLEKLMKALETNPNLIDKWLGDLS